MKNSLLLFDLKLEYDDTGVMLAYKEGFGWVWDQDLWVSPENI